MDKTEMANKNPDKSGLKIPSSNEARKNGAKGGIKSGQVRKERAILKKLGYTGIESFDKLNELQKQAIVNGNINAAIKAEELKGKLAGLYVEKTAQTDTEGNDIYKPPVFNIVPVEVVHGKQDSDTQADDVSLDREEEI